MKKLTLLFTALVIAVPIMLSTWNAQTTPEQTEEPAPRPTAVTTQAVATARAKLPSIYAFATSRYHQSRRERHVIEGFEGFEYRCNSEQLLGDDHAMRAACHNKKVEFETLYSPCAWTIDGFTFCLWSPVTDRWGPVAISLTPPPYVTIQPTPEPAQICERVELGAYSCRRNPNYTPRPPVPFAVYSATTIAASVATRLAKPIYRVDPRVSPGEYADAVANIDVAPPAATALQSMVENFPIDAAATALQSMVDNPGYRPTLATGCDQLPCDAAHAAACNAYKAAYEARYGNPCRHDIDGAAVCLH